LFETPVYEYADSFDRFGYFGCENNDSSKNQPKIENPNTNPNVSGMLNAFGNRTRIINDCFDQLPAPLLNLDHFEGVGSEAPNLDLNPSNFTNSFSSLHDVSLSPDISTPTRFSPQHTHHTPPQHSPFTRTCPPTRLVSTSAPQNSTIHQYLPPYFPSSEDILTTPSLISLTTPTSTPHLASFLKLAVCKSLSDLNNAVPSGQYLQDLIYSFTTALDDQTNSSPPNVLNLPLPRDSLLLRPTLYHGTTQQSVLSGSKSAPHAQTNPTAITTHNYTLPTTSSILSQYDPIYQALYCVDIYPFQLILITFGQLSLLYRLIPTFSPQLGPDQSPSTLLMSSISSQLKRSKGIHNDMSNESDQTANYNSFYNIELVGWVNILPLRDIIGFNDVDTVQQRLMRTFLVLLNSKKENNNDDDDDDDDEAEIPPQLGSIPLIQLYTLPSISMRAIVQFSDCYMSNFQLNTSLDSLVAIDEPQSSIRSNHRDFSINQRLSQNQDPSQSHSQFSQNLLGQNLNQNSPIRSSQSSQLPLLPHLNYFNTFQPPPRLQPLPTSKKPISYDTKSFILQSNRLVLNDHHHPGHLLAIIRTNSQYIADLFKESIPLTTLQPQSQFSSRQLRTSQHDLSPKTSSTQPLSLTLPTLSAEVINSLGLDFERHKIDDMNGYARVSYPSIYVNPSMLILPHNIHYKSLKRSIEFQLEQHCVVSTQNINSKSSTDNNYDEGICDGLSGLLSFKPQQIGLIFQILKVMTDPHNTNPPTPLPPLIHNIFTKCLLPPIHPPLMFPLYHYSHIRPPPQPHNSLVRLTTTITSALVSEIHNISTTLNPVYIWLQQLFKITGLYQEIVHRLSPFFLDQIFQVYFGQVDSLSELTNPNGYYDASPAHQVYSTLFELIITLTSLRIFVGQFSGEGDHNQHKHPLSPITSLLQPQNLPFFCKLPPSWFPTLNTFFQLIEPIFSHSLSNPLSRPQIDLFQSKILLIHEPTNLHSVNPTFHPLHLSSNRFSSQTSGLNKNRTSTIIPSPPFERHSDLPSADPFTNGSLIGGAELAVSQPLLFLVFFLICQRYQLIPSSGHPPHRTTSNQSTTKASFDLGLMLSQFQTLLETGQAPPISPLCVSISPFINLLNLVYSIPQPPSTQVKSPILKNPYQSIVPFLSLSFSHTALHAIEPEQFSPHDQIVSTFVNQPESDLNHPLLTFFSFDDPYRGQTILDTIIDGEYLHIATLTMGQSDEHRNISNNEPNVLLPYLSVYTFNTTTCVFYHNHQLLLPLTLLLTPNELALYNALTGNHCGESLGNQPDISQLEFPNYISLESHNGFMMIEFDNNMVVLYHMQTKYIKITPKSFQLLTSIPSSPQLNPHPTTRRKYQISCELSLPEKSFLHKFEPHSLSGDFSMMKCSVPYLNVYGHDSSKLSQSMNLPITSINGLILLVISAPIDHPCPHGQQEKIDLQHEEKQEFVIHFSKLDSFISTLASQEDVGSKHGKINASLRELVLMSFGGNTIQNQLQFTDSPHFRSELSFFQAKNQHLAHLNTSSTVFIRPIHDLFSSSLTIKPIHFQNTVFGKTRIPSSYNPPTKPNSFHIPSKMKVSIGEYNSPPGSNYDAFPLTFHGDQSETNVKRNPSARNTPSSTYLNTLAANPSIIMTPTTPEKKKTPSRHQPRIRFYTPITSNNTSNNRSLTDNDLKRLHPQFGNSGHPPVSENSNNLISTPPQHKNPNNRLNLQTNAPPSRSFITPTTSTNIVSPLTPDMPPFSNQSLSTIRFTPTTILFTPRRAPQPRTAAISPTSSFGNTHTNSSFPSRGRQKMMATPVGVLQSPSSRKNSPSIIHHQTTADPTFTDDIGNPGQGMGPIDINPLDPIRKNKRQRLQFVDSMSPYSPNHDLNDIDPFIELDTSTDNNSNENILDDYSSNIDYIESQASQISPNAFSQSQSQHIPSQKQFTQNHTTTLQPLPDFTTMSFSDFHETINKTSQRLLIGELPRSPYRGRLETIHHGSNQSDLGLGPGQYSTSQGLSQSPHEFSQFGQDGINTSQFTQQLLSQEIQLFDTGFFSQQIPTQTQTHNNNRPDFLHFPTKFQHMPQSQNIKSSPNGVDLSEFSTLHQDTLPGRNRLSLISQSSQETTSNTSFTNTTTRSQRFSQLREKNRSLQFVSDFNNMDENPQLENPPANYSKTTSPDPSANFSIQSRYGNHKPKFDSINNLNKKFDSNFNPTTSSTQTPSSLNQLYGSNPHQQPKNSPQKTQTDKISHPSNSSKNKRLKLNVTEQRLVDFVSILDLDIDVKRYIDIFKQTTKMQFKTYKNQSKLSNSSNHVATPGKWNHTPTKRSFAQMVGDPVDYSGRETTLAPKPTLDSNHHNIIFQYIIGKGFHIFTSPFGSTRRDNYITSNIHCLDGSNCLVRSPLNRNDQNIGTIAPFDGYTNPKQLNNHLIPRQNQILVEFHNSHNHSPLLDQIDPLVQLFENPPPLFSLSKRFHQFDQNEHFSIDNFVGNPDDEGKTFSFMSPFGINTSSYLSHFDQISCVEMDFSPNYHYQHNLNPSGCTNPHQSPRSPQSPQSTLFSFKQFINMYFSINIPVVPSYPTLLPSFETDELRLDISTTSPDDGYKIPQLCDFSQRDLNFFINTQHNCRDFSNYHSSPKIDISFQFFSLLQQYKQPDLLSFYKTPFYLTEAYYFNAAFHKSTFSAEKYASYLLHILSEPSPIKSQSHEKFFFQTLSQLYSSPITPTDNTHRLYHTPTMFRLNCQMIPLLDSTPDDGLNHQDPPSNHIHKLPDSFKTHFKSVPVIWVGRGGHIVALLKG
jgi:hypothetical protein